MIVDVAGDPDPVGLLFAGSSTRTIANHIGDVLSALGVSMYDGNVTPNTPPTIISSPNPGPVFEGELYTYDVDATDTEGQSITYGLQSAPAGMAIDGVSGLITWTPGDADAGMHPVTVRAQDVLGEFAEQNYMIQVDEALNATPTVTITAPADGTTIAPGDSVTFTGTATDSEDGGLTAGLAWVSDLDGALGTGGSFDSTSLTTTGTHTVTASVTDSGLVTGSDSITVTLTDRGALNEGRSWVGRVEIGFSDADEVAWSWSTGGQGGSCTPAQSPCTVDTGLLRKNIGSATLSVEVIVGGVTLDPADVVGPSQITVTKP